MKIGAKWNAVRARRWLRSGTLVGDEPYLAGKPALYADGGRLYIGNRLRLSSRPVTSHLVAGPGATLQIGDDVSIGCGAAIAAFQHVQIGDGTQVGPFVIIMDTNFHGAPGDQSIQHDCRPVTIGRGCRIGTRVTITRGTTIGDGAEILAGSVVSTAIPAGVCAAGSRARIIGRAMDPASRWDSAAAALPEMLMESLGLDSPPDLDGNPIPGELWGPRMHGVCRVIEHRFGIELDRASAQEIRTFADIAAATEQAVRRRARESAGPQGIPGS